MDNVVQASVQLTIKDYMRHSRYNAVMCVGKIRKSFFLMPLILILFIIIITIILKNRDLSSTVLLIAYLILIYFLPPYLKTRKKYEKLVEKKLTYHYKLYPDRFSIGIVSPDKAEVVESEYRRFMSATERKDAFYFYASNKHEEFILPKRCIPEESVKKLRGLFRKNLRMNFYL